MKIKKGKGKSFFKNLKMLDWIIIAGIAVAICVVGVLLFFLLRPQKANAQSDSVNASMSQSLEDESYDKDAVVVTKEKFSGTVLEEGDDAGVEYIEDTLFIGDSNTVRMMSYGHTTLDNDVAATSMGIQHVLSKPIVFFQGYKDAVTVPKAVEIIQPRRIVITYGTNNTIGWTPQTFVEEYKKAVKAIKKAYPYTDIIINSIPPVDKIRENMNVTMKTIDAYNKALAEMAKKEGYKFLNSAEVLKDETHGYAKTDYTISDGIHLSKKGMEALFKYIRTHSYETEDTRPKPLKKVPGRKETPPNIITNDPIFDRSNVNGLQINYVNANPDMGSLSGEVSQKVAKGKTCSPVTAVPNEGYAFSSWSCTVGNIANTASTVLDFTVPDTQDKTITITANFVGASLIVNGSGGAISSVSLKAGESYTTNVGFAPQTYQHSRDYSCSSSNNAVATVSADGTITAVAKGEAVITYQALSGKLSATVTVTVTQTEPETPTEPENPDTTEPETPDTGTPDTGTPDTPDTGTPDTPDTETPDTPNTETPDTPDTETPTEPGTPTEPETPETGTPEPGTPNTGTPVVPDTPVTEEDKPTTE